MKTSAENATADAVVILGIVVIILSTKFEVLVYFEISAGMDGALGILVRQLFDQMVILQRNGPIGVCRDRVLIIADGIAGGSVGRLAMKLFLCCKRSISRHTTACDGVTVCFRNFVC